MTREEVTLSLNRKDRGPWEGRQDKQQAHAQGWGKGSCPMKALATGCPFNFSPRGSFFGRGPWSWSSRCDCRKDLCLQAVGRGESMWLRLRLLGLRGRGKGRGPQQSIG